MLHSWGVGSTWERQPGLQEGIKVEKFPTTRALAPSGLPTSRRGGLACQSSKVAQGYQPSHNVWLKHHPTLSLLPGHKEQPEWGSVDASWAWAVAAPPCWPEGNKTEVSSQPPPKERKKHGGYQHPDWPPNSNRRPWSLQQIVQRQEKANTPFDLQLFEHDIFQITFYLTFPQTHKKYILLLGTKGKHTSHFLNKKVVDAQQRDVRQCKIVIY